MANHHAPAEVDAGPSGIDRRRFLVYMVSAPTLTMAVRLGLDAAAPDAAEASPGLPDVFDLTDSQILAAAPTVYNLIIQISADNKVTVRLPREEVGQGITTAMAMLVADELDARLEDIDMQLQDATPSNGLNQLTGGSATVVILYEPVRTVAAAMRARLVTAAAHRWGLPANTLTTSDTMVFAPPADGRSATYGSLAAAARDVVLPEVSGAPKQPGEFKVIGTPTPRIDARDIVTGRAKYTLDLDVPGALPTVVARPPTHKGTVGSWDASVARSMPGVVAVTAVPTGIAVVAETFDQALKARDTLQINWHPGPMVGLSDANIEARLRAATLPFVLPPLGSMSIDGEFDFAWVNHAPLETMCAVADVRSDRAEVWVRSKAPIVAQSLVAQAVNLPVERVHLHVIRGGGSFGRGLFHDPAVEAAVISKGVGRPVKLLYTRADDMQHGRMRPASFHRIRATHLLGTFLSYEHRLAAAPLDLRHGFGDVITAIGAHVLPNGFAQYVLNTTQNIPYRFGLATYLLNEVPMDVATSPWRSIYSGQVAVADEIMVDEIARRLRQDPVAFRLAKVEDGRLKAVIQKVATAGNWGRAMPAGHAQGIGVHQEYKSVVAFLVEIDCNDRANPRVTKAVCAVDVGFCVNPTGLKAQMSGVLIDALSVILQAGNHFDNGTIRETSYTDFRWARMRHSPPEVEVHVMPPTTGRPGGAGELGLPAASAAVANAYARATGTSPRRFPIAG